MSYKVSVYIPAFNAEKTIEYSIKSIQNQSLAFDEIIVVDGGSSDLSALIAQLQGAKVVIQHC